MQTRIDSTLYKVTKAIKIVCYELKRHKRREKMLSTYVR